MGLAASEYLKGLIDSGDFKGYSLGDDDLIPLTGVVRPGPEGRGIEFSPGMTASEWFSLPDEVILDLTVIGGVMVHGKRLPLATMTVANAMFLEGKPATPSPAPRAAAASFASPLAGVTLGKLLPKRPPKPIWDATGCEKCKFEVIATITAAGWARGGPSSIAALKLLLDEKFAEAFEEEALSTASGAGIGAIANYACKKMGKCG